MSAEPTGGSIGTRPNETRSRCVAAVLPSERTLEGEGFMVRRPFPTQRLNYFDPFLLLDHMGPIEVRAGEAKGAPDHPHRGFETVSYLLQGQMEHTDSAGHRGVLGAGDVQWMTAGSGVIHSEMPSRALQTVGGRVEGFQIWVNLPQRDKMMAPRYQEVPSTDIPVARSADGLVTVKVIAGEAMGVKAVIETRTPVFYLHFTLKPGARFVQPIPAGYNVMAYVMRGAGWFATPAGQAKESDAVFFESDGDAIVMEAAPGGGEEFQFLLLGGVPLHEPVARYGPFVMNTAEEIQQAFRDYQSGAMGRILR